MSYAVLVLEQPWWELNEDPGQTSVRYFLDGLSRLDGLPTFYATFYDSKSFGCALQYLVDARKLKSVKHLIVYLASHGAGARIGNGSAQDMNLRTVFNRIQQMGRGKVVGLILDSCEVGGQWDVIEDGMKSSGLSWLLGYGASIDWLTSTLINLRVLSGMSELKAAELRDSKAIKTAMQESLGIFNPFLVIDDDTDEAIEAEDEMVTLTLAEALSIAIQGNGRKPYFLAPKRIWPHLF
jgi:hypothetical protein